MSNQADRDYGHKPAASLKFQMSVFQDAIGRAEAKIVHYQKSIDDVRQEIAAAQAAIRRFESAIKILQEAEQESSDAK